MRAEEIIAEVYRQKKDLAESGGEARGVTMSMAQWRMLRDYRARLGDPPGDMPDYLQEDSLFGLEIFIEPGPVRVLSGQGGERS